MQSSLFQDECSFLLSVDPLPYFLHPVYIPPVNGGGELV